MGVAFDSRGNHLKIARKDAGTINIPGFTFSQADVLYTHSLGYRPNFRAFFDYGDDIWPASENFWGALKPDLRSSARTTSAALSLLSDNIDFSAYEPTVYYSIYEEGDTTNSKVDFSSKKKIERVVAGPVSGSFSAAGSSAYTTHSIPNPYGALALPVLRWSLDQETWVDQDIAQYEDTVTNPNYVAAISHCTPTEIHIEAINSYGTAKTVYYQVWLMKKESDETVLDSREKAFLNFSEGSKSITISGTINTGQRREWEATLPIDASALGVWYVSRDDVADTDYQYPYRPLDFVFTAGNLSLITQITYEDGLARIRASMWNVTGVNRTIPSTVITYRYALFKIQ